MSGVAGANRIERTDVVPTLDDYIDKVLSGFGKVVEVSIAGSYHATAKKDFGDIDLIITFEGDDKKVIKSEFVEYVSSLPDNIIVPFKSERYKGRKYYNAGELVTVQFPQKNNKNQTVQIDNIVALSKEEHDFKQKFLNLTAEQQGLILGLVKTILIENPPEDIFNMIGLTKLPKITQNQEYEFNLSSKHLELRLITFDKDMLKHGQYKEQKRQIIWQTTDWNMIKELLIEYDLSDNFEGLIEQIKNNTSQERSLYRIKGVFDSMISVKSGEINTEKGKRKEFAKKIVDQLI